MTEGEIMVFAKEYADKIIKHKMTVHDTFNKEQVFAEISQAFIEGADFMYYSNNEELKKELAEKDKLIEKMKCCANCEFQYVRSLAPKASYEDYMKADLKALSGCTHIAMLDGGEGSNGAKREKAEAERLGIEIMFFREIGGMK